MSYHHATVPNAARTAVKPRKNRHGFKAVRVPDRLRRRVVLSIRKSERADSLCYLLSPCLSVHWFFTSEPSERPWAWPPIRLGLRPAAARQHQAARAATPPRSRPGHAGLCWRQLGLAASIH
eukprot:5243342-Prymnesium_polylepis.1